MWGEGGRWVWSEGGRWRWVREATVLQVMKSWVKDKKLVRLQRVFRQQEEKVSNKYEESQREGD